MLKRIELTDSPDQWREGDSVQYRFAGRPLFYRSTLINFSGAWCDDDRVLLIGYDGELAPLISDLSVSRLVEEPVAASPAGQRGGSLAVA